jgi:hypothetical protein
MPSAAMVAISGTLPFRPTMPTGPEPVTLSAVVRRAVAVVDPQGDAGLEDLLEPFEDDDEPLGGHGAEIAAQRIAEEAGALDPQGEDPGVQLAAAVATYLAFRRDEVDAEPRALLTLAARAAFDGDPPAGVRELLMQRGARP